MQLDRQNQIMDILRNKKTVKVADLSRVLYVSETTVRRELERMEQNGLLRRVHGGAVIREGLDSVASLAVREYENEAAKEVIGRLSSQLVSDGDVLFIDSGSTVMKMIPHLHFRKNLIVNAISPKTAMLLAELADTKVYCSGGRLEKHTMTFVGSAAKQFIEAHNANSVFLSCRGISMDLGITEYIDELSEIKRLMIKHSRKVILLCDNTKFDKVFFSTVCGFDRIHTIVTDKRPDELWVKFFTEKNIQLIYPEISK